MRERNKWLYEFSKKVVKVVISLYVVHIVYVDILAFVQGDSAQLGSITSDLTQVVIVCLGGYLFKACLENVFKIKNSNDEERMG